MASASATSPDLFYMFSRRCSVSSCDVSAIPCQRTSAKEQNKPPVAWDVIFKYVSEKGAPAGKAAPKQWTEPTKKLENQTSEPP